MRQASLQELLSSAFDYETENFFTAIPGIVVTVRDNFNQLSIDAQPTINIKERDGAITERPTILNIPVQMPASTTSAITFPLNVGDPVLLIFSMRGLDVWKRSQAKPSAPSDLRKFDKRDCIAIPGIFPFPMSVNDPAKRIWTHNTQDTVIVHNIGKSTETEIRLKAGGGVVINTNQDAEVNCNNANVVAQNNIDMSCVNFSLDATTADFTIGSTTWSGGISHSGDYTGTGTQTFNGIIFGSHDHIPGPGPSNP